MIAMETDKPKKFLTPGDVAERLNLSEMTILRLLRKRELPGYKISGSWRVDKVELEDFIARQRNIQD